jgi:hypothetical protein
MVTDTSFPASLSLYYRLASNYVNLSPGLLKITELPTEKKKLYNGNDVKKSTGTLYKELDMKSRTTVSILIACTLCLLISLTLTGCIFKTQPAKSALKTFLTYEKYNQWEEAWAMLHPDSQAAWEDMNTFVKEMNHPTSSLKKFSFGRATVMPSWTSRSSNKTYTDVVRFPTTLVYSTNYGEMERSQMIHAVQLDGNWKFFQNRNR